MATTVAPRPERPAGPDPIDALVPPPRSRWVRLLFAAAVLVSVGVTGYLWHFGYLRPSPDCCGTGSSSPHVGLASAERTAVVVTSYVYNSSGVDLVMTGGSADLPGADVVAIAPYPDADAFQIPPGDLASFPAGLPARSGRWLGITFVPTSCGYVDDWGTLKVDLEVAESWLPTFGRNYVVPVPVVPTGAGQLAVLPPDDLADALAGVDQPLVAACALLGR